MMRSRSLLFSASGVVFRKGCFDLAGSGCYFAGVWPYVATVGFDFGYFSVPSTSGDLFLKGCFFILRALGVILQGFGLMLRGLGFILSRCLSPLFIWHESGFNTCCVCFVWQIRFTHTCYVAGGQFH